MYKTLNSEIIYP